MDNSVGLRPVAEPGTGLSQCWRWARGWGAGVISDRGLVAESRSDPTNKLLSDVADLRATPIGIVRAAWLDPWKVGRRERCLVVPDRRHRGLMDRREDAVEVSGIGWKARRAQESRRRRLRLKTAASRGYEGTRTQFTEHAPSLHRVALSLAARLGSARRGRSCTADSE